MLLSFVRSAICTYWIWLNQEIMNRYVDKLGIQKQTEELTFFQVMSKYHVLFSACLLEEYGDIFEFPSDLHKYAVIRMLHFIGENGTAPVQLEEALVLNNQKCYQAEGTGSCVSCWKPAGRTKKCKY